MVTVEMYRFLRLLAMERSGLDAALEAPGGSIVIPDIVIPSTRYLWSWLHVFEMA